MREILFRGKRKDTGEWIEGWYQPPARGVGVTLATFVPGTDCLTDIQVDPETVGQFTGILDKHDKKIFEGDIILLEYPRVHYSVQDRAGGFCLIDAEEGYFDELYMYSNSCEVVGNLYDHGFVYKGELK